MSACSHSLGTPGRPCPWCLQVVPEIVSDGRMAVDPSDTQPAGKLDVTGRVSGSPFDSGIPAPSMEGPASSRVLSVRPDTVRPVSGHPSLFDAPLEETRGASFAVVSISASAITSPRVMADAPRARLSDPATAHEAAARALPWASVARWIVLCAHADAGERGLTGNELEQATGKPYAKLGPRRPALEAEGLVEKVYKTPSQPVRREGQQVYRCTELGYEHARAIRNQRVAS